MKTTTSARPRLAVPPAGRAGGALPAQHWLRATSKARASLRFIPGRALWPSCAVGGTHFCDRSHFRARQIVLHSGHAPSAARSMAIEKAAGPADHAGRSRGPGRPCCAAPAFRCRWTQRPAAPAFAGRAPVATLSDDTASSGKMEDAYRAMALRCTLHGLYQEARPIHLPAPQAEEGPRAGLIRPRTNEGRASAQRHYSKSRRGFACGRALDRGRRGRGGSAPGRRRRASIPTRAQGGEGGMLGQKLAALGQDLAAFRGEQLGAESSRT